MVAGLEHSRPAAGRPASRRRRGWQCERRSHRPDRPGWGYWRGYIVTHIGIPEDAYRHT